jgi:hypothetical protein
MHEDRGRFIPPLTEIDAVRNDKRHPIARASDLLVRYANLRVAEQEEPTLCAWF